MPVFSFRKNAFFAGLVLFLACGSAVAGEQEIVSITVMADRALSVPLTQLASDYSRSRHESVSVSFAPSFEQTMAVQEGEPADIIISAHPKTFQQLQGVYDVYSVTPLVASRLALVTSTDYPDKISEVSVEALREMRKQQDFLLAIATPAAAAEGYYAEEILRYLRPRLFLSSKIVQLQNTPDILGFLAQTPAFGILFESDALQAPGIRQIATFPENWYKRAVFTGAVIAGGNMEAARQFLKFLRSPEAQRLFIKYALYPEEIPTNSPSVPLT